MQLSSSERLDDPSKRVNDQACIQKEIDRNSASKVHIMYLSDIERVGNMMTVSLSTRLLVSTAWLQNPI